MSTAFPKFWYLGLVLSVICLYGVRQHTESFEAAGVAQLWSKTSSPLIDQMQGGSLPGLLADFKVLDVFSMYYDSKRLNRVEDLEYIAPYLNRAQLLDPNFYDVYRLASSLLAFDAKQPREAIDLLQKGIYHYKDDWEFPFFAGFIAHDQLHDDKLAFELMSQVSTQKNVPLMVLTLASRFLASSTSNQDAIIFLKGLLQFVPDGYRAGIKNRIHELEG